MVLGDDRCLESVSCRTLRWIRRASHRHRRPRSTIDGEVLVDGWQNSWGRVGIADVDRLLHASVINHQAAGA